MTKNTCALQLNKLIFDQIIFDRKGLKNDSNIDYNMKVELAQNKDNSLDYKVTLILEATKNKEYEIRISLTGYFTIEKTDDTPADMVEELLNKNTVAIMMPYLRSELTLLTSQPETNPIVLPPFNVGKMMDDAKVEY